MSEISPILVLQNQRRKRLCSGLPALSARQDLAASQGEGMD